MASGSSTIPIIPAAPPTTFPPLTKGYEFEFLVLWRFDANDNGKIEIELKTDWEVKDGYILLKRSRGEDGIVRARHVIRQLLHRGGIATYQVGPRSGPSVDHTENYKKWGVVGDASLDDTNQDEWNLRYDGLPFSLADIELVSPVLQAGDSQSDQEVGQVVGLLKSQLLLLTPSSTGHHFHIGQGDMLFDFPALQNIAIVLYSIDVWLKDLHPERRRDGSQCSIYCRSTRRSSQLARGMTASEAETRRVMIEKVPGSRPVPTPLSDAWTEVFKASSHKVISTLMMTPNRGAYSFNNVTDQAKPTIEFRQAAGTMNIDWILCWSTLLVRLVDWARQASDSDIRRLIVKAGTKEIYPNQFPIDSLLRGTLEIPDVADYIAKTNPDTRATPRLQGQEAKWRKCMEVECPAMGAGMLPRADWP